MPPDVARGVSEVVREALHGRAVDPEADLVDAGLDSVGMITMLAALEETFGVTIPSDAITPEAFRSIATISSLVRQLVR